MLRLTMSLLLAASCFVVSGCSEGDAPAPADTETTSSDDGSDAKAEGEGSDAKAEGEMSEGHGSDSK